MPITDTDGWAKCKANNTDPYGGCCVKVAERVMAILDAEPDALAENTASDLVIRADNETKAGGITGFMAGAVASIVSGCHSRGDEFRRSWNGEVALGNEGERANDSGGVLNPAIMNVATD